MPSVAINSPWEIYRNLVATDTHEPDFRGRLAALPLPGTPRFNKTAGRAGNAIVIQIGSAVGIRDHHERTLRSLGLHGIDTASLVDTTRGSTRGNISTVSNLIRVIELKHHVWKTDRRTVLNRGSSMTVEHIKYGSSRNPCDLLRSGHNQYWYSELSKRAVSMAWSTEISASATITSIIDSLGTDSGSGRIIRRTQEGEEIGEGTLIEVAESLNESEPATVEYVQVCIAGLSFSWKEPFKRFTDSQKKLSEISVSVPKKEAARRHAILSQIIATTATNAIKEFEPIAQLKDSRSVGFRP